MSQLTTITTSVAAAAGSAVLALGAVAALSRATAGDTPAPGSDAVVRPAGITLNGIDRAPADVIPAATAIEYGLIAAIISVDHSSASHIGVLPLSPRP